MKATIIFKDIAMESEQIEGENLYVDVKDGIATIRDCREDVQKALIPVPELIAIFIE